MNRQASRSVTPIPGGGTGAPVGTWGLLVAMIAFGTFVAGMAAAALYLHTGHEAWPPAGIERPAVLRAAVAVACALVGTGAGAAALRRMRRDAPRQAAVALILSLGGLTAAGVLLVVDLQSAAFGWQVHAYASVYWVLTATSVVLLAIGALAAAMALVQTLVGLVDQARHLELAVTVMFLWFVLGVVVVLLALVHGLPAMTGGGP